MSPAMTNATITLTAEVESLMGTLCALLDRESEAVQTSDFDAFRAIQNDKFAMLTRYRALMETLQRQSSLFSKTDTVVLDRLKTISAKLKDSTARNGQALEAGRNSMQRIVDRIVRCARETVHANRQSYTSAGRAGAQSPFSLQVDEVL